MIVKWMVPVLLLAMVTGHGIKNPLSTKVPENQIEKSKIPRADEPVSAVGRNPLAELVYSFVQPDYDWPSEEARHAALRAGSFIPENIIISGIKVWHGEVYVTVPRWLPGVPATLSKLVRRESSQPTLQPLPDWRWQTIGDCRFLQYVQSMEIDPNTGHMWILDTGRINTFSPNLVRNLCPPKLVIYDLTSATEVNRYIFPADVASPEANFLNDIVLDYIDGHVGFAYITDTTNDDLGPGIVVYDALRNSSHRVFHASMRGATIPDTFGSDTPVDGIAMSPDFNFLYYATVTTQPIYQVPTAILRQPGIDISAHVRNVGNRMSLQMDGMVHSKFSMYFGNMAANGITRWDVSADVTGQAVPLGQVNMTRYSTVVHDDVRMKWPDTFSIDEFGYLWFVANDLPGHFGGQFNNSGVMPHIFIWKLNINERSYLDQQATDPPDIIG